jgi:cytoskeleton protein RodZ
VEANGSNPQVQEPSSETGLGGRLVKAREARGLTLAVVAHKLRLSAATLQALESNRYEDLPEPIFVRGYLRAYARLLGMDMETFVAEYDRVVGTPGPVLAPIPRVRRQATARVPHFRGAAALIVVAVVILFGFWWYSRLQHDVPAQSRTPSPEVEQPTSPASVLPPPQMNSPKPGPGPVVALAPEVAPQSLASDTAAGSVATARPEPPIGLTSSAAEPALPQVGEAPIPANADAVEQRRDVEATVEPTVTDLPIAPLASERGRIVRASRAPMGEDVLVIKASDESWADIVDGNGYQLLYYPLRPGMVLRLQGQAPLRVFLGNAPAVDLSLNQKRFDHTSFHRRNNTARFTVDDSSR